MIKPDVTVHIVIQSRPACRPSDEQERAARYEVEKTNWAMLGRSRVGLCLASSMPQATAADRHLDVGSVRHPRRTHRRDGDCRLGGRGMVIAIWSQLRVRRLYMDRHSE
jgi:hypothetical protein